MPSAPESLRRAPASVGEIESFITMLMAARENRLVRERLERLLSLPDASRQAALRAWLTDLIVAKAPQHFIMAIACLLDDRVAHKAYELIYPRGRTD